VAVADALAPLYGLIARPIEDVRGVASEARGLVGVAAENQRLRAENEQLRRWYDVAMALAAENEQLKANLHWMPDPKPAFLTARAVADTGGLYARSVLLSVPPADSADLPQLNTRMVAMDAYGLVGRVIEVGARSARLMLINDMTSHVPVTLEGSHAGAILVGTNSAAPRLMYYPEDVHPEEGERVVTSSEANVFPAGLPVGTVHYLSPNEPVVEPYAHLDHVGIVRLFDYGLSQITPPDAPGRVPQKAAPTLPLPTTPHTPGRLLGPGSLPSTFLGVHLPIGRG